MARLPTKAEIIARHQENFADAFPGHDEGEFFAELERLGKFKCSSAGRGSIVLASWHYCRRMTAGEENDVFLRGRRDDLKRSKSKLESILSKASQVKYGYEEFVKLVSEFRSIAYTDFDASPTWFAFVDMLEAEGLIVTDRFDCDRIEIRDEDPGRGSARTRLVRAVKKLLDDWNDALGIQRGARENAAPRKKWLAEIVGTLNREGVSLKTWTPRDGWEKRGAVIEAVQHIYSALPVCCRRTSFATLRETDIPRIARQVRSQRIEN